MTTDIPPLLQLIRLRHRRERLLTQIAEIETQMGQAMDAEKRRSGIADERLGAEAGVTRETATRWRRRAEKERAETEAADQLIDEIVTE